MAKKILHSREEQTQWLERWRASGLSGVQFAAKHGLNGSTLYRWAQVSRGIRRVAKRSEPAFTQVHVRDEHALDNGVIEIDLPGRGIVRVKGNVDRAQLCAVLETLGSC